MIVCTRKRPARRPPGGVVECWAIAGLATLEKRQAWRTGKDADIGGSLAYQYTNQRRLTERQWEAVVYIARRYASMLGEEPDPRQLELL